MTRTIEIALNRAAPSGDRKVKFTLGEGVEMELAENGVLTVEGGNKWVNVFNPHAWQFFVIEDDNPQEDTDD